MRSAVDLARSPLAPSLAHAPRALAPLVAMWSLTGCGDPSAARGDGPGDGDRQGLDVGSECTYPAGAVEPMALGEVLSPYRWPVAFENGSGRRLDLDLVAARCDDDDDIDWSPFDVLLFISIPAW